MRLRGLVLMKLLDSIVQASVSFLFKMTITIFREVDVPLPDLQPNQVLIQVAATSVNPVDCKIRRGAAMAADLPAILHGDVAGTLVAVGQGVTAFAVGDEVYGCAGGFLVNVWTVQLEKIGES